jgi:single-stranded DNA-binding protein
MPDLDKIEKGMAMYVCGRMRTVRYNGADGTEKLFYEVLATKVRILDEEPEEPFY